MDRADFESWNGREVARLLALVENQRRYYQEMVASLPVGLVVLSASREQWFPPTGHSGRHSDFASRTSAGKPSSRFCPPTG